MTTITQYVEVSRHTIRHALQPWERRCECRHIATCVVCNTLLPVQRVYADVCGEGCFGQLTQLRAVYREGLPWQ